MSGSAGVSSDAPSAGSVAGGSSERAFHHGSRFVAGATNPARPVRGYGGRRWSEGDVSMQVSGLPGSGDRSARDPARLSRPRAPRMSGAMAPGVTDRLWEIGDIVALVGASDAKVAKRGPCQKKP